MAFTQISTSNLDNTINTKLAAGESANASIISLTTSLAPKIASVNVASNTFTVLDDTAVNVGGGYIVVTGANFQSGATVLIDTVQASAVTYVNSTTLQVQVPARSAATYNLYVVNPDGGTGIRVNSLTYSSVPSWTTSSPLTEQASNAAFNITFSANGASSYSVASGSSLPPGTTLAANGYFYGTVSIGAETTYSFVVRATDSELQDADKTFQVTISVTPQGRLFAWGDNLYGELGLNDYNVSRSSPTQVGSATNWKQISSSGYNGAGIKTDGTLWTWGRNGSGQLGLNDRSTNNYNGHRSSPTQVGTGTNWSLVDINNYALTAAIKTDGTLWTWGNNQYGQLGLNDRANRSSPTQVGSATNWSLVSSGTGHMSAIKTDGTLWTWGNGGKFRLGTGNQYSRSSPTQVGSATNWSLVSASGYASGAIKTDGTLWLWGRDGYGSFGQVNTVRGYASVPTQTGTNTDWSKFVIGQEGFQGNSFAIKTNGTLWSMGRNEYGELGQNDRVQRSSPTQVGTGTDWSSVEPGKYHAIALKTNGTLWTWGSNPTVGNGEGLGQNDNVGRSSPTQVGANTDWILISAGERISLAVRRPG